MPVCRKKRQRRSIRPSGSTASSGIDQAIRLYRKLGDADGEARAMVVRLHALEGQGAHAAAVRCGRKAIRVAEEAGHELPAISALLEYGRLLIETGSTDEGVDELRRALAKTVVLGNKHCEFHAHYYLWKAYERTGDLDRMKFEFQAANYFVKFTDDTTAEARELRRAQAAGVGNGRSRRRRRSSN
jgi:hypothetical protein